ncbi:hypothetical protein DEO72_LG1g2 [Vigna unguiculata]|uniref:Uncharacterized protein n=1 Tax=Vigna unguiculata TaxID=3917 RepID=A0A4D6KJ75_VIGUN|nr:hypothetical protein DEO72_LG1g2 [Vigna unguiculata]
MKRHVAELIEKIEKLCNEGHQTESVSVHIPSTHEREGPSSHTNGQRRTVQLLGVGRLSYELSRMQTTRVLEISRINRTH